jgi:hypothetical protein
MKKLKRLWPVLMVLAVMAGAHGGASAAESESRESSMKYAHPSTPAQSAIPPIDAAAPAHVETASFGLG